MIMKEKTYKNIRYLIAYPDNFNADGKYPMLIHLHGAGGRGNDLNLLKIAGPVFETAGGRELPLIVVAPQCNADTWFMIMEQLLDFIKNIAEMKNTDKTKVYLSGASMGGYACWQVAMTLPELFAAIVPVCGGGMYWNAAKLKKIPVWAFHGALDPTVFVTESINMVNAVNKAGGEAKITVYPKAGHDSWKDTFANDELYEWLLSKKR